MAFRQKVAKVQQDRAAAAYWESPVGRAQQAAQQGSRYFEAEYPHYVGAADIISQIEDVGWQLAHASWVFIETGAASRDHRVVSGQRYSTSGQVIGIYLFRRREALPR